VLGFIFIVLVTTVSVFLTAGTGLASDEEWIVRGDQLFAAGEWDAAERLYLKAAESSKIERRIRAYEQLVALYRKVRSVKKKQHAQSDLDRERSTYKRMVPPGTISYEHYTVRSGDTYHRLAASRGISEEWLKRINRRKMLRRGDRILVPKEKDRLVVDKARRRLLWLRGRGMVKVYPIAVGRTDTETPEGDFIIVEKIVHPTWYKDREVIPPGDPRNLLGTRWMGLSRKGYGIHGTRYSGSIGAAVTDGCIRMHNRDIEELFEWVPKGTRVLIQTAGVLDDAVYQV
jgi:hypothetical protein